MSDAVPIGRIRRPHGLRGEVVVEDYAEGTYTPPPGQAVTLGRGEECLPAKIASWRPAAAGIIARFEGCVDRHGAELLRDHVVSVPRGDLPPLDEDEFYHFELIGLPVWDTEGRRVGVVAEIYGVAGTDILVIRQDAGRPLEIPFVKAHVAIIKRGEGLAIRPYAETL